MKFISVLVFTIILSFTSCKKESGPPDCETRNYGSVYVSFQPSTLRHSIIITFPGSVASREKIIAAGILLDSVQLAPGTYPLSVARIDPSGAAVDQQPFTAVVTRCSGDTIKVNF